MDAHLFNSLIALSKKLLAEFIGDFYDRLNSATHGFASLDYEHVGFRADDLVKVDILIHGEQVDAFSFICHRNAAYHRALAVVQRLKELIPRQLFEVAIQATVGRKVIVRQTVRPLRKDVLAKCYGGDVTRKRKLLEKQKEGKKRPVIAAINGYAEIDGILVIELPAMALLVAEPTMSGVSDLERAVGVCNHFGIPAAVCINKYDLNEEIGREIERYCS